MTYTGSEYTGRVARCDQYEFGTVFHCEVPKDFGFTSVTATLSVPRLPEEVRYGRFAAHPLDRETGQATQEVICLSESCIAVSKDLGENWEVITPDVPLRPNFRNCFRLENGDYLVQNKGLMDPQQEDPFDPSLGAIYRFDSNWNYIETTSPTKAQWHGTAAIDEANGVIIFGEYHMNAAKYLPEFEENKETLIPYLSDVRLLRSSDGGRSWHVCLEKSPFEARHFHSVMADRKKPGVWWATTGDRYEETHVYRSKDDGLTWNDTVNHFPDVSFRESHENIKRSLFRQTDAVITKDSLIWGADDLLGSQWEFDISLPVNLRGGSRMYQAKLEDGVLQPRELGLVGNAIRSVVDVGEFYLAMTEARAEEISNDACVMILSSENPEVIAPLLEVPNLSGVDSRFTVSLASSKPYNGTFFSYRGSNDLIAGGANILRWDFETR